MFNKSVWFIIVQNKSLDSSQKKKKEKRIEINNLSSENHNTQNTDKKTVARMSIRSGLFVANMLSFHRSHIVLRKQKVLSYAYTLHQHCVFGCMWKCKLSHVCVCMWCSVVKAKCGALLRGIQLRWESRLFCVIFKYLIVFLTPLFSLSVKLKTQGYPKGLWRFECFYHQVNNNVPIWSNDGSTDTLRKQVLKNDI